MNHSVLYMQQQAEQRVRQMREQARRYVEEPPAPAPDTQTDYARCTQGGHGAEEDSDRWLLLLLCVLLHQSGARPELLCALLYLAL